MINLSESTGSTPPSGPTTIDLAHELNNLLTVVLGSLEQLHRQPLNERGKSQLERAQWGVQKAGDLLKQILGSSEPDEDGP